MPASYDIAVLGGGPGGYSAAIRAAQRGAKVALIEKESLGGTCLNRGCIPTKALLSPISLYEKICKSSQFGISTSSPTIDLAQVVKRKDEIVKKLVKGLEFFINKK